MILDQFTYGSTDRLSPEAPAPVFMPEKSMLMPGGAANVALNVKALGAKPVLYGMIGYDENAKMLVAILKKEKIKDYLFREEDRPTILKHRLVARDHHLIRIDEEKTHPISAKTEKEIIQKIKR